VFFHDIFHKLETGHWILIRYCFSLYSFSINSSWNFSSLFIFTKIKWKSKYSMVYFILRHFEYLFDSCLISPFWMHGWLQADKNHKFEGPYKKQNLLIRSLSLHKRNELKCYLFVNWQCGGDIFKCTYPPLPPRTRVFPSARINYKGDLDFIEREMKLERIAARSMQNWSFMAHESDRASRLEPPLSWERATWFSLATSSIFFRHVFIEARCSFVV